MPRRLAVPLFAVVFILLVPAGSTFAAHNVPVKRAGNATAVRQRWAPRAAPSGPVAAIPPRTPDPARLRRAKRAAARRLAPSGGGDEFGPSSRTAVFSGSLNAPGLAASASNNVTPPDATGSVGPSHYLEFVNSLVGVYSRSSLGLLGKIDLPTFVGNAFGVACDPQIQWDSQASRWLYVALDCDGDTDNHLYLGWSKTSSPTPLPSISSSGNWCRFEVSTGARLEDYPKLGHDNALLYVGVNSSQSISGRFVSARIRSFKKPAIGDTTCPSSVPGFVSSALTTSDGDTAFTPVPANTAESSASGFVVAADSPLLVGKPNQIMAWRVSGGGGGTPPTLTGLGNIKVSAFDLPANVPQPGTSGVVDSLDARLTQAVARTDADVGTQAVWTQHTVDGPGGRSVVRWYELLPGLCADGCPGGARRQQGTIQSYPHFAFNGAISPTRAGNAAVLQYNVGSRTLLPQIRAQSRRSGEVLGTMRGETLLGGSTTFDQDFTCRSAACRWGDYAGASPDPNNSFAVWGSNQVVGPASGGQTHWRTRNFAITTAAIGVGPEDRPRRGDRR